MTKLPTPTVVAEIPAKKRANSISGELAAWVKAQDLNGTLVDGHKATEVFKYDNVAQNLAATLAKDHGLNTANRQVGTGPNAKGHATLFVQYVPDLVEHFKAEAIARSKKGKK